jgi:Zn-dependent protease with chaperone function
MRTLWRPTALAVALAVSATACAVETTSRTAGTPSGGPPAQKSGAPTTARSVDPQQLARLQHVMVPLVQKMNKPAPIDKIRVGIMDSPEINAANASPTEFYVTTGLLQKANDDQLRAVLAHEVAHADLGHVTKTQALGAGVNIGMVILDQIIPGSGALTPIAGRLLVNAYTRKEEYEADAHGVEILRRAGFDGKALMANTLTWLQSSAGDGGGGFFSTHPATGDRIEAVQKM